MTLTWAQFPHVDLTTYPAAAVAVKVGNAEGVFHFCIAYFGGEFRWRPVVQAAVWPLVVVVMAPSGDLSPRVE